MRSCSQGYRALRWPGWIRTSRSYKSQNTSCRSLIFLFNGYCTIVVTLICTWDLGPVTDYRAGKERQVTTCVPGEGQRRTSDFRLLTCSFWLSSSQPLSEAIYLFWFPKTYATDLPLRLDWLPLGTLGGCFRLDPSINKTTIQSARGRGNSATCRVTITGIKSNGIPGRPY
jgi:hypothetical protein